jgi:hypothetical protein
MVRYSFLVRLLHPLLSAGFDRRFQRVPGIPSKLIRRGWFTPHMRLQAQIRFRMHHRQLLQRGLYRPRGAQSREVE